MYKIIIQNKEDIREEVVLLSKKEAELIKQGIKTKKYCKYYYTTICKNKYQNGGFDIIKIN